jgi:hypothetical protein
MNRVERVLTFFTAPKPFTGHIAVIQRNAMRSWAKLPGCEILVFGEEEGVNEMAAELGASHLPEVARSPHGTPLVGDMFSQARTAGQHPILCFVNADVIFTSALLDAVRRVEERRFLLAGQRWDLDIREELGFEGDWEPALLRRVRADGRLHPPAGSDYFAYPRDVDWQMPPFAVGRVGWDNWTLRRARQLSLDVIDATRIVKAIHQDHAPTVAQQPEASLQEPPEAARNLSLLDGQFATLDHATHVLTRRWVLPAIRPRRLAGGNVRSYLASFPQRVFRGLRSR